MSQSDGEIAIWRAHPAGGAPVEEMGPWPGHRLRGGLPTEAWISFFRKGGIASEGGGGGGHDASLVVSGGEDAMLKGWDLRGGGSRGALSAFVCKDHEAGVTAGQWHPWRQHIFARWASRQLLLRTQNLNRKSGGNTIVRGKHEVWLGNTP